MSLVMLISLTCLEREIEQVRLFEMRSYSFHTVLSGTLWRPMKLLWRLCEGVDVWGS